ncbi:MAG TPA: serine hydrolase domain-containing protein [Acidimicrobiales bacterium]|nr:serine hydrolase domain-containing protein [Acidimicrobiales bacterium]
MAPAAQLGIELAVRPRAWRARWDRLVGALERLLAGGYPPAVALAVVERDGPVLSAWGGFACTLGEPVPLERTTLFDLASLTKVVATVPLALLLAERGAWDLADPVRSYVPGYPRPDVTLRHLLTHTSGLVAHRPFFETLRGRAAIRAAVLAEAAHGGPTGDVVYSDLNFMLLGWALEARGGARLDRLVRDGVTRPLQMAKTRFTPPPTLRRRCAATELDGDQRNEPGLVWGVVHDGNAAALGGIAGHAGLFAPLGDMIRFVRPLLDTARHPVLSVGSLAMLSRRSAATGGDVRSIGWRLAPEGWGDWPVGTYWHTGFTGTSLLVAPGSGVAVVCLTNGVHPARRPEDQARVRAELHALVAEAYR